MISASARMATKSFGWPITPVLYLRFRRGYLGFASIYPVLPVLICASPGSMFVVNVLHLSCLIWSFEHSIRNDARWREVGGNSLLCTIVAGHDQVE